MEIKTSWDPGTEITVNGITYVSAKELIPGVKYWVHLDTADYSVLEQTQKSLDKVAADCTFLIAGNSIHLGEWKREVPKETGWYWYRRINVAEYPSPTDPAIVYLSPSVDGTRMYFGSTNRWWKPGQLLEDAEGEFFTIPLEVPE